MMRAVRAGLTKFCPMPPNICLTTMMAAAQPNTAISGFRVTGRFRASRMPVTTQLRSPTVWGRFMTLRHRYSKRMQAATQVRISAAARMPNRMTEAIMAGVKAMITSSMMFWVVLPPLKWGEDETMSFSIYFFPPAFLT